MRHAGSLDLLNIGSGECNVTLFLVRFLRPYVRMYVLNKNLEGLNNLPKITPFSCRSLITFFLASDCRTGWSSGITNARALFLKQLLLLSQKNECVFSHRYRWDPLDER
jgi:hypothetical protein